MWAPGRVALSALSLFGLALGAFACDGGDELRSAGPGGSAWRDEGTVSCASDAECGSGETCAAGVCQMKRCGEPDYRSVPPLGYVGYFKRDREIMIAETLATANGGVRGYDVQGSALRVTSAPWAERGGRVIDLAGGNYDGKRPESVATIEEGSTVATVKAKSGNTIIPLGFAPVAITSGDVDADGIDEIIALAATGTVAACSATTKKCTTMNAPVPVLASDVAAGDIDGDGYAEVVVLAGTSLTVVNFDAAVTGNRPTTRLAAPSALIRISIGDLDGDGKEDLVGLEDSWGSDEVHVLDVQGEAAQVRATIAVSAGARDVTVGGTGADKTMIAVLGSDNLVETIAFSGTTLTSAGKTALGGAVNAARIALADIDGDSPTRTVRGAPKLVPGRVVPMAVLTVPPYSRTYSDGVSRASIGGSESNERTDTQSVSLRAGVGISVGADLGPIVKASVGLQLSRSLSVSDSRYKATSIGGTFTVFARPGEDGFAAGAVMLGCACYHRYEYAIDDPRGVLGKDVNGKTLDVFVPVGGQTSVWSTRRYNALAEALGTLPKIQIPHRTGQVESYPGTPKTLDGEPIAADDMVFMQPRSFRTSDVASVSFDLVVTESNTRSVHVDKGVSISGEIGAFGVSASGELGVTVGKGYSIGVSQSASFSGNVPAVRNDPSTPEDEFGLHGYSFTPILYRHRYLDDQRQPSAFYVLTYAVGK